MLPLKRKKQKTKQYYRHSFCINEIKDEVVASSLNFQECKVWVEMIIDFVCLFVCFLARAAEKCILLKLIFDLSLI